MNDNRILSAAKFVAYVGAKAVHGAHTAKGAAGMVARMPVVGPVLGLGLVAAGAVAGAVHGIKECID